LVFESGLSPLFQVDRPFQAMETSLRCQYPTYGQDVSQMLDIQYEHLAVCMLLVHLLFGLLELRGQESAPEIPL
jgi:hypothetical protein